MPLLTLERDRKTSSARLGGIALGAVMVGVVGIMAVNQLLSPPGYAALGEGRAVKSSRVTGVVESVDGGTATVRTNDGRLVTLAVDELAE